MIRSITLSESDIARFWSKVKIGNPNECWEWQASLNNKGYGKFGIDDNIIYAHRVSWVISSGEIPDGLFVLHKCDNRKCVNGKHLFLGTAKDNSDDRDAKGRTKPGHVPGEKNGRAKLKVTDVIEIRKMIEDEIDMVSIAKKYSVGQSTIFGIKWKQTWKSVE